VRSDTMKDVMLVLFTIVVIGLFFYALVVEPILDRRNERRWRDASGAAERDEAAEQAG
jgi:peptidoglycan/LPS O-acetylase OafA/YrhL